MNRARFIQYLLNNVGSGAHPGTGVTVPRYCLKIDRSDFLMLKPPFTFFWLG